MLLTQELLTLRTSNLAISFKWLFSCKNSHGRDMHFHEHPLVIIIIVICS